MVSSNVWASIVLVVLLTANFASADDSSILLYSCFGGTVVCAILALWFAYKRDIEIDLDKVQREAMTIRRPPGFLQSCMEPKDPGLTTAELRCEGTDSTV